MCYSLLHPQFISKLLLSFTVCSFQNLHMFSVFFIKKIVSRGNALLWIRRRRVCSSWAVCRSIEGLLLTHSVFHFHYAISILCFVPLSLLSIISFLLCEWVWFSSSKSFYFLFCNVGLGKGCSFIPLLFAIWYVCCPYIPFLVVCFICSLLMSSMEVFFFLRLGKVCVAAGRPYSFHIPFFLLHSPFSLLPIICFVLLSLLFILLFFATW